MPRERQPYAARDAAFAAWAARGLCVATAGERAFCRAVFNAGWNARKVEQYTAFVNAPAKEPIDGTRQDVLTLFPTDAELDNDH